MSEQSDFVLRTFGKPTAEDLKKTRSRYLEESPYPTPNTTLQYSMHLVQTTPSQAIPLLNSLLNQPECRHQALFWMACAYFRCRKYHEAKKYLNQLRMLDSDYPYVQDLLHVIDESMEKDGLIGLGIIGGIAIAGIGILSAILSKK
eukprot:NODE_275_length_12088_cov_0.250813.p8 type:complete len:146 gc:universal NODE_275_length_12088_cov_0.250813:11652-11215(-)